MATLLRKRNPNKHFKIVWLTATERAMVLASEFSFINDELNRPMHVSRVRQVQEALGLAQKRPTAPKPEAAPIVVRPILAPEPKFRPVPAEIVPRKVFRQVVQFEGDWYRPYPGEIFDERLEALLQQAVTT